MDYIKENYIHLSTVIIVIITLIRAILKDIEKKSYLTLTPSIESHKFTTYTIKVRVDNKSKKPIEVYTCHLLTNHNEDIADNCYKESTQVDKSRHSIAKEQIHNITIKIPYRGYLDFCFKDVRLDSLYSFIAYIECDQDGVIKRIESHSGLERIQRIG